MTDRKAIHVPGINDAAGWIDIHYGAHLNRRQCMEIARGVGEILWEPFARMTLISYAEELEKLNATEDGRDMSLGALAAAMREAAKETHHEEENPDDGNKPH